MLRTALPLLALAVLGLMPPFRTASGAPTAAQVPAAEVALRECLALPSVGRGGRAPLPVDPVQAALVAGTWRFPKEGEAVERPGGTPATWQRVTAGADGAFQGPAFRGGYAAFTVEAPAERTDILEAAGHAMVYVNGEPRMGDPYGTGYVRLPVRLRAGRNELLFQNGRGQLRARLLPAAGPAALDLRDTTLPDLLPTDREPLWAAAVVANHTPEWLSGVTIEASAGGRRVKTALPPLAPLAVRKSPLRLPAAKAEGGELPVELRLLRGREALDTGRVTLRVRQPGQTYRRTFVSGIDGSVQYYGVNPASRPGPGAALVLTLHGASVEAIGQADAYGPKSWAHLVAPTNRRPYGFDWEDWGRLDTLEVLEHARKALQTDPRRTYLTGHSMGGHGAWHVGATFPDRFAAIAPSAGWISFWSYGAGPRDESASGPRELLARAASPSDTLALSGNYGGRGVYILHGGADDNVPVTQARTMQAHLAGFHRDFVYHEQPGAGHWWDDSDEPGAACVDWPPIFDFFARRSLPAPAEVREVRFTTASPGVSARSHWVTLAAQQRCLRPSSVRLRCDPGKRRFVGTTENVARLALDVTHLSPGAPLAVELDGQALAALPWPEKGSRLWLERCGERWRAVPEPGPEQKGPQRYGPFKEAFRNRPLLVYATGGTPEENAWSYTRARFDAEQFWYRGNGLLEIVPDTRFEPGKEPDRSVILYGNAAIHRAWAALLGRSPVQVTREAVTVGGAREEGRDLACLAVRPRPGSDRALVGIVAGTGPAGLRLTNRLPYFVSGVAYPDCLVIGPESLTRGAEGARLAAYFGPDWSVEAGELARRAP